MIIPGFTADLSLKQRYLTELTVGAGRNYSNKMKGSLMLQAGCHRLCCPSGDCDTTCCAGDSAHVECHDGKANAVCDNCFLTTACVSSIGLPDDCEELTVLRQFRDRYLLSNASGREMVADYYRIAPAICTVITRRSDAFAIYDRLYRELVRPTVCLIKRGKIEKACRHYRDFTLGLRRSLGLS